MTGHNGIYLTLKSFNGTDPIFPNKIDTATQAWADTFLAESCFGPSPGWPSTNPILALRF